MLALGVVGARAMAEMASAMPSLLYMTSLSLGDNNLGDEGVEALSIGLKESKSLATLDLSNHSMLSTRFGPKGATALASAIAVIGSLTSLDLSGNILGGYYDGQKDKMIYTPEGPKAIADALLVNGSLTKLDVWDNRLGDKGKDPIRKAVDGREGFHLQM